MMMDKVTVLFRSCREEGILWTPLKRQAPHNPRLYLERAAHNGDACTLAARNTSDM